MGKARSVREVAAQHQGLGKRLVDAAELAKRAMEPSPDLGYRDATIVLGFDGTCTCIEIPA